MNNFTSAITSFDSALSIMIEHARATERADRLTRENSAFRNFEDLLQAGGDYRPSLSRATPDCRELGALYDAAQIARGDDRRAFMYGTPARKGSLIDPANYDAGENWYRQGNRIAWWDKYTRQWIAYTLDSRGHQTGSADLYPNSRTLLAAEHAHA